MYELEYKSMTQINHICNYVDIYINKCTDFFFSSNIIYNNYISGKTEIKQIFR